MKKICNVLLVIILLLIFYSIYLVITDYYIVDKFAGDVEVTKINSKEDNLERFQSIRNYYENEDIVGKLIIDDLSISNFITQSNDNEYYLTHNLFKEYDKYGNAFVDYRNDIKTSKQLNIYGHNSHYYDVPFSRLDAYLDEKYYLNNKYIYLETEGDTRKYEIFAVYGIFKSDNEHMKLAFNSLDEWNNHFNNMKHKSIYDTGVLVDGNDFIITLQTCLYNYSKGEYLIINAKEIERY